MHLTVDVGLAHVLTSKMEKLVFFVAIDHDELGDLTSKNYQRIDAFALHMQMTRSTHTGAVPRFSGGEMLAVISKQLWCSSQQPAKNAQSKL